MHGPELLLGGIGVPLLHVLLEKLQHVSSSISQSDLQIKELLSVGTRDCGSLYL